MKKIYTTRKEAFFVTEEKTGRVFVRKLWQTRSGDIFSKWYEMNPINKRITPTSGTRLEEPEAELETLQDALREGIYVEQKTIYGEWESQDLPKPPEDAVLWWNDSNVDPTMWYRPAITYIRTKDKDEKEDKDEAFCN